MLFGVELPTGVRRCGAFLQERFSLSLPWQSKSASLVLRFPKKGPFFTAQYRKLNTHDFKCTFCIVSEIFPES
jgi:hypothetical protein